MASLNFNRIYINTIPADSFILFTVTSGKIWKIESVGIGGTKGAVYLKAATDDNIAILFSTIQDNDYGSQLPYWLDDTAVDWKFVNDSNNVASVCITEWNIGA